MHIEEFQRYDYRRNFSWLLFAIIGFVFGCGLLVIGVMAAGGGHGTYVPIIIFSSPLGFFGGAVFLFGTPILWSVIGAFAYEMLESGGKRGHFLVLMGLHFGCIPWFLSRSMFGDWDMFWEVYHALPVELIAGFAIYAVAQALTWNCFVVACFQRRTQFSIRSLLVVTLLFAIWLSWMVIVVRYPFTETDPDHNPNKNIAEKHLLQPEILP